MADSTPSKSSSVSGSTQMEHNPTDKADVDNVKNEPQTSDAAEKDVAKAEEAQAPAEQPTSKRNKIQTFVLMTTLCMAVFLAALDITIVSTALPTISEHFDSTSGYTWVGSAFLLAAAVVAPSWGKFSDIFGRKPILLVAIALFFLGSGLCGGAVNLPMLIVGRAVQGTAAGGLLSLVNIVVGDLFSQRERGKYYGFIGMTWAVAFVLGPLIGGAFTTGVSWRWCFYINLPISGTSFFVILMLLRLDTPKTPILKGLKVIDWPGSLALIGGLLMFLLGLQFGGTVYPWRSATVICLIVFGVITCVIFVLIERYVARYPLVPVHLYANVSNTAIIFVNLCHGIIFTAVTYFLPMYCQSVLSASPLLSGVLLLPFAGFMSISVVTVGIFIKRTGRYLDCIRVGFGFLVLGTGLFYDLPAGKSWAKIILYQFLAGLGVGLGFQPPLIALQGNVPAQENGSATASFGLVRNVASAIGVVLGSVVFANDIDRQQSSLASLGSSASMFSGAQAQANVIHIGDLPGPQQVLVRQAFWVSIRNIWVASVAFAAAAFVATFFIHNRKLNKTHETVRTGLEGEEERRRQAMERRAAGRKGKVETAAK